jgi:hypothetical protein
MFNVLTVTEGWEGAGCWIWKVKVLVGEEGSGEVFEKLRPATWLRLKIANFYAYSYFYCRNVHRVPYLVRDKRINTANCE